MRDSDLKDNPYAEVVPEPMTQVQYTSPTDSAIDEVEFLKSIIRIYMGQKVLFDGQKILCTIEELSSLIRSLTGGDVSIETSDIDIECGCCSANTLGFKNISKIWITKDGVTTIFRYSYPQFIHLFEEEYNISLKLVRITEAWTTLRLAKQSLS